MRSKLAYKEALWGYIFAFPWFLGFFAFTIYPILMGIYYSFTEYNVLNPPIWTGITNYVEFSRDPLVKISLYNTLYYTFIGVSLWLLMGLVLALLVHKSLKGVGFYRTIFYIPNIVPFIASVMIWLWILNPMYGLANVLLRTLGLTPLGWLGDEKLSKPSLIFMGFWGVGGTMLIFLAGLNDIPAQLYEAAKIDGANSFQQFRYITLPMLSPVILFNLITGIIGTSQVFASVYIMTKGGPNNSTLMYVLYLYDNAFRYFKMGYASAMGVVLFLIILLLTILLLKSSQGWVHYERL